MDMALAQRILDAVAAIPAGRVATYGDVAADAGGNSPRFAGWVLSHLAEDDLPWHRVLPMNGRPVPRLADRQLARLAAEGIPAVDGRISMRRFRVGTPGTSRDMPAG
jgi:methylated-DNA-protein-cysteine methyltransferase-like protein